jgi:hypothetical protein
LADPEYSELLYLCVVIVAFARETRQEMRLP